MIEHPDDAAAIAVAHDSAIAKAIEAFASSAARAWRTSSARAAAERTGRSFQAMTPAERRMFFTAAGATAVVVHVILRWL